jgi:Resolvase, N terminal domain
LHFSFVDPRFRKFYRASFERIDRRNGWIDGLRSVHLNLVWKLDRLGQNLRHLVNTVHDLTKQGVGFRSLIEAGPANHARADVVAKDLGINRSLVFGLRFSCKKEVQSTI